MCIVKKIKQRCIQHTIDVGKGRKKRQKQEINLKKTCNKSIWFFKAKKVERRQKIEERREVHGN